MLLGLLAIIGAAEADVYGGIGVTAHPVRMQRVPRSFAGGLDINAPGMMGCIGGQGFGAFNGTRIGGEGRFCDGPYGAMGFGGVQGGVQSKESGFYTTAFISAGGGWIYMPTQYGHFDATYVYATPTIGMGIPFGGLFAVETNLYWMTTYKLRANLDHAPVPGAVPNHVGIQVSLMVGDFRKRKRSKEVEVVEVVEVEHYPPPPPMAPPPPPRPAPIQPEDVEASRDASRETEDRRPLAIPAR